MFIRTQNECAECHTPGDKCRLDEYDGSKGLRLICDDCIDAAARACDKRRVFVTISRPEGYYHSPIGTFD